MEAMRDSEREQELRRELNEITARREFCYSLRRWLLNPTPTPRGPRPKIR
jgi:hypothetical protein